MREKCSRCRCSPGLTLTGVLVTLGVALVAVGAGLGWGIFPSLKEQAVAQGVRLVPETAAWKRWVEPPVSLLLNIYIMNLTNPREVDAGAKPVIAQIGPYVYREHRRKENIHLDPDRPWVRYEQFANLTFSPELSGDLRDTDLITTLNPLLMGTILVADRGGQRAVLDIIDQGIPGAFPTSNGSVFMSSTVRELLLDGVRVQCGEVGSVWQLLLCAGIQQQAELVPNIREDQGDFLFSFLYHKQNRADGLYTVNTGVEDPKLLGWIHEWENSSTLPFWGGPECNVIRGTDAAIFPPFLTRESRVDIFSTDLCRSLEAVFERVTKHEGVLGLRFVAADTTLASVERHPDNFCFCDPEAGCLRRGAFDLHPCLNAPVVMTFPHFLHADPEYLRQVHGVSPNPEKHQTFVEIEPRTGIPLVGWSRAQFNMLLKPVPGVQVTRQLPQALLPLLWIEQGARLGGEEMGLLRAEITKLQLLDGLQWGLLGTGAAALVTAAVLCICSRLA